MNFPFTTPSSDTPVGAVIAYAGMLSNPVSSPPSSLQYPSAQQMTGLTNSIEGFGWMVCDGRKLYCKAYPELFQALGFLYSLDGEPSVVSKDMPANQTFRIPDYRGYFLRAGAGETNNDPDQSLRILANGQNASSENVNNIGTFQQDALQTHQHQYANASGDAAAAAGEDSVPVAIETPSLTSPPSDELETNPGGIRVSSETRSKNVYVHYLIKYAYLK